MKRVWKCDFCFKTSETIEEMEIHESKCSSNPILRLCNTCDHQVPMDYSMDYECGIHNMGFYIDVEDGDKECSDWKNEEERSRKVKKLITKLDDK